MSPRAPGRVSGPGCHTERSDPRHGSDRLPAPTAVDLPELTPEDAALLAQFRTGESPPADAMLRVQRRVRTQLAELESRPSLASRWSMWLRAGGLSVAIAAAMLLVVAGSSRLIARLSVDREVPSSALDSAERRANEGIVAPREPELVPAVPATLPSPVVVPEPPSSPAEWPGVAGALEADRARAPARPGKPSTAAVPAPIDSAAEIQLLARVKSERDASARLELIRQHGREFANGKLVREVAVLEIQTLCALGRKDDAAAQAKTFVQQHPDSAYAAIAARACEEPGR